MQQTTSAEPRWADVFPWRAPAAGEPVIRSVYDQVRGAIGSGVLRPGERLPSSRSLAALMQVARASVVAAYDQLLAEGYVAGRRGAGTFVAADLSGLSEPTLPQAAKGPTPRPPAGAAALEEVALPVPTPRARPFANGRTLMDARALEAWSRATRKALRTLGPEHFGYADARGDPALRSAIADYLRATRAVVCQPDQVIITAGAQHALDIAARILLSPGDAVWLEDPGYPAMWHALRAAGAQIHPIPVDAQGIEVGAGVARAPGARLAVVTPSHQYPLGVTLSLARRLELVAWARQAGAWIVEDDYASEFRYSGPPLASLQGLDGGERVIYVGTLNKALFPGLRMGYLVAPAALAGAFATARQLIDRQPPTLTQAIVLEFIRSGQFAGHIRRRRLSYRTQRDALVAALRQRLGGVLEPTVPEQGMQLVAYLAEGPMSDIEASARVAAHGLAVQPISRLYRARPPRSGLILGFSGFPAAGMDRAAVRLAAALA